MKNTRITPYIWHAIIWITGFSLLNFTGLFNTIGVFHYDDGTLLWPSIVGTVFNMVIFYGNAEYLLGPFFRKYGWKKYLAAVLTGLVIICLLESVFDFLFYDAYYERKAPADEIITTNLLINGLFFLLPSYMYRFATDWRPGGKDKEVTLDTQPIKEEDSLTIKSGATTYQLKLHQIRYVESQGNNIHLHLPTNTLKIPHSLSQFEEKLPDELFIRCHNSFVVSIEKVTRMDYDFLYVNENTEIPIGRSYREKVKEIFG